MVAELHRIFHQQPRHSFPLTDSARIPENGLYILFEQGEKLGSYDRIVQVGTHGKPGNLPYRMRQHFADEDKNRSIFRKHIGRALLAEEDHPYLPRWELEMTSVAEREKNSPFVDEEFEKSIERRVTAYIHDNFSYCMFAVEKAEDRQYWKSKIISTLAQVENVAPSEDWLGHHATSPAIRGSGLWHVQELNGEPLTSAELVTLAKTVGG